MPTLAILLRICHTATLLRSNLHAKFVKEASPPGGIGEATSRLFAQGDALNLVSGRRSALLAHAVNCC